MTDDNKPLPTLRERVAMVIGNFIKDLEPDLEAPARITDHHKYTVEHWKAEVLSGSTQSGYADWVQHLIDINANAFPDLNNYFCSVGKRIFNVTDPYVAAKYFVEELRQGQPVSVSVVTDNQDKFEIIIEE